MLKSTEHGRRVLACRMSSIGWLAIVACLTPSLWAQTNLAQTNFAQNNLAQKNVAQNIGPQTAQVEALAFSSMAVPTDPHLAYLLQRRGSVRFNNVPLPEVMLELSQQWNVNILAATELEGQVTGSFREAPLSDILDILLSIKGYQYRMHDRVLLIVKRELLQSPLQSFQPTYGSGHSPVIGASTFATAGPESGRADQLAVPQQLSSATLGQAVALERPRPQVRIAAHLFGVPSAEVDQMQREQIVDAVDRSALDKRLSNATGARLLANQELMTIDGETAVLELLTRVPTNSPQRSGSEEPLHRPFVDAGIKILVTPRIIDHRSLELRVVPESSTLVGFNAAGQPILDTNRIEVSTRLVYGQTLMLGRLPYRDVRALTDSAQSQFWNKLISLRPRAQPEVRELVCLLRPELVDAAFDVDDPDTLKSAVKNTTETNIAASNANQPVYRASQYGVTKYAVEGDGVYRPSVYTK